ncbi:MAG: FAD-binding oxidoreductase [Lentisphaerae bacterium]|jgi:D-lactate dehydrogenase (cytochrome)|nr:FAD-binding oxidoreductase [Lentisphaerota bacterium]MBT4820844.1 FAD-binding oxidoreductase [Lentisphaerota bacterium]MBT5611406.1 FAD-binding oxidoreductase [Lentisphaerota bacterium]MBT7059634.1 FAD-binding oxidoreductase [Lentisphaerota bacterium]MBT7846863.1 FAD-binding oxidoreductase [Lentisphaerota bacterium]
MDVLTPTVCPGAICPDLVEGSDLADYGKYLADESRRSGTADALAFPRSTAEVCGAVNWAKDRDLGITVSGARTGIAAGAVPDGGLAVSLERMNRVLGVRTAGDGTFLVRCQSGVLLSDLQHSVQSGTFADAASFDAESLAAVESLKTQSLFYPPDPTETSATVGGTVACNASGAHTFRYGPTRPYVHGLTVVLGDGRVLALERGRDVVEQSGEFLLATADGQEAVVRIPEYTWPTTKNSAGYYAAEGMDILDFFVGSEGTLGIVTEIEVRAIPAPEMSCAVVTFWTSEEQAVAFTETLQDGRDMLSVEAIEYVGPKALSMLRNRRTQLGATSGVPGCLPETAHCAIYLDVGTSRDSYADALSKLAGVIEDHGGSPSTCWSAVERDERERLRHFRHALPETVNAHIAEIRKTEPSITKLGTDMAVPGGRLVEAIGIYRSALREAGLDYVIFGHIGDNHLHVNILPRNAAEYRTGWDLYHRFADAVVGMGGSPAAEHGIGKLKTDFLRTLFHDEGVRQMLQIKAAFDPHSRLGKGTLFA